MFAPDHAPLRSLPEQLAQLLARGVSVGRLRPVLAALDRQHAIARQPASAASRCVTCAGREDPAMSTRSSTAFDTLFTCWPPGPEARTNRSSISV